jgi:hypothetical protein
MKRFCFFTFFITISYFAHSQDTFLLPEKFFLEKGEKIDLHLITGERFVQDSENDYQPNDVSRFMLYEGSKKTDLATTAKAGNKPAVSFTTLNTGVVLVELVKKYSIDEVDHDKFMKFLEDESLTKLSAKMKNSDQETYKVKNTSTLKTLINIEKSSGSVYEKPVNEEFEIILKQNPYKMSYGDDITGVVLFKGKPLANAAVDLYSKSSAKNVFEQKLMTDQSGQFYIKMSREGLYMIKSAYAETSKDKQADIETWTSTFTFAFSNKESLPNTYKEYGFGNIH